MRGTRGKEAEGQALALRACMHTLACDPPTYLLLPSLPSPQHFPGRLPACQHQHQLAGPVDRVQAATPRAVRVQGPEPERRAPHSVGAASGRGGRTFWCPGSLDGRSRAAGLSGHEPRHEPHRIDAGRAGRRRRGGASAPCRGRRPQGNAEGAAVARQARSEGVLEAVAGRLPRGGRGPAAGRADAAAHGPVPAATGTGHLAGQCGRGRPAPALRAEGPEAPLPRAAAAGLRALCSGLQAGGRQEGRSRQG
jgi:hypothetical protein